MHVLPLLVAILIGAMIPFQIAANKRFGASAPAEVYGAAANFVIGAAALVLIMGAMRTPMVTRAQLQSMPWWAYIGGFVGVFYVYGSLKIAPQIGVVLFSSLLILGQMTSSILLEHSGAMAYPKSPITLGKIGGVALVLLGVWLIRRSNIPA